MMISNVKGQFTGVTVALSLQAADRTESRVEAASEITLIHTQDEGPNVASASVLFSTKKAQAAGGGSAH
jgi:polyisoprenoid-binding protein YceI